MVDGFTVMVKVIGVPIQPLAVGVTVIVATIGLVVALVAVNGGTFPVPLAPNPMEASLFVHAKVVPATGLVKLMGVVTAPIQ